ncbi:hypothetical protein [Haloferula sp.]|uniref:hypothetical protein n=1 Tax=Haloferula sp. TaxID=2497595 RepID=UPI003C71D2A0
MNIREVIQTLDQMQSDGIVGRCAIGGAVAATFYLEPFATLDVDIFVSMKPEPGSLLLSLEPIFAYLEGRGCTIEGEYVIIGGWPVQFLPPTGALVEEALADSVEMNVEGLSVRVFTAEHLAAIALETGRAKDKSRLLQFVESGRIDGNEFGNILSRHGLVEKWERFSQQFLSDS